MHLSINTANINMAIPEDSFSAIKIKQLLVSISKVRLIKTAVSLRLQEIKDMVTAGCGLLKTKEILSLGINHLFAEAATGGVLCKNMLLEISQKSRKASALQL